MDIELTLWEEVKWWWWFNGPIVAAVVIVVPPFYWLWRCLLRRFPGFFFKQEGEE